MLLYPTDEEQNRLFSLLYAMTPFRAPMPMLGIVSDEVRYSAPCATHCVEEILFVTCLKINESVSSIPRD